MPKKLPESDLAVEISLRVGSLQITAKGSISELAKQIGAISDFAELATSKLFGAGKTVSALGVPEGEEQEVAEEEPPVIKVTKSTTENLRTLFGTTWGKKPRNLSDVTKALEVNAAPDSAANVAGGLLSLVKLGTLRRIKKSGMWHYFQVPST